LITKCTVVRAPVDHVPSASGTSHLGMIDIQATTKSKYYDILNPEDVVIDRLFLFVFTYMVL
jgi:hypothetical protein